jgi:hypothetical protein
MPPSKSEKVQAVFNRLFWCWLGEFLTDQSAGPIGLGRLQKLTRALSWRYCQKLCMRIGAHPEEVDSALKASTTAPVSSASRNTAQGFLVGFIRS